MLGVAAMAGFVRPAAAQDPVIVPEQWIFTPLKNGSKLAVGEQFRLLLVTSTKRNASSTDIADYDTHVQNAVAAGHMQIRPYSAQFKVVGSTSAINAKNHTGTTYTSTNKGVPIYWLKTNPGSNAKVADDYEDFYTGSGTTQWDNRTGSYENGGTIGALNRPLQGAWNLDIWTGTDNDGTTSGTPLGGSSAGQVSHGELNDFTTGVFHHNPERKGDSKNFYGLSPVFEVGVVPVSVSLSVSGSGAVTEGGSVTITATGSQQNDAGSAVSIPIHVRPAETTALASDYTVASSISIADGATTGMATFSATSGDGDELGEMAIVGLDTTGTWPSGWEWADPDSVSIAITDDDPTTVALSVTDGAATEEDAMDTAEIQLTLGRALESGESLGVPLQFTGGDLGTNFSLALNGSPTGVTFSSSTVMFAGGAMPSATTATVKMTAIADNLGVDETVTVSIPASDADTPSLTATNLDGGKR